LKFSGEGFTPGGTVTISGGQLPNQAKAQSGTQADEPLKADENGKITGTLVAPESVKPGKYAVVFTDDETGEATDPHQFTVTEDATDDPTEDPTTPVAEAKLIVSPESVTPQDFINEKKGVKLSVKDCKPGSDVRFMVTADGNSRVTAYDRTVKADKDGKAWVRVFGTSSNASAYVGSYSVTATGGDDSLKGSFKVTAGSNAGGGDGGGDNGSGAGGNDGGSG
ncbi:hypothetical protein DN473_32245, partial [Burkholderia multivorans]